MLSIGQKRLSGLWVLGGIYGQGVQLFARLEADSLAGSDADLSTSAWIAADAGFARTDAEDAEAAELNAIARGESSLQTFEYGIHGGLRLGSRQARSLDHVMDNILLDQCRRLMGFWIAWNTARATALLGRMLGELTHVVNPGVLQYH